MLSKTKDILKYLFILFILVLGTVVLYKESLNLLTRMEEAKTPINIERLLDLPNIDVIIGDATLQNVAGYTQQLNRSGKVSNIYFHNMHSRGLTPILNIFIDSSGGRYAFGMMIATDILGKKHMGYRVNCYATRAYSMAFTILQACSKRVLLKNGRLGVHKVFGSTRYNNYMADIKRARYESFMTGKSISQLVKMRGKDMKYYTAEEALKEGFIDEVL